MCRIRFSTHYTVGSYVQRLLSALADNPSVKELDLDISRGYDNFTPDISKFKDLLSMRIRDHLGASATSTQALCKLCGHRRGSRVSNSLSAVIMA